MNATPNTPAAPAKCNGYELSMVDFRHGSPCKVGILGRVRGSLNQILRTMPDVAEVKLVTCLNLPGTAPFPPFVRASRERPASAGCNVYLTPCVI